MFSHFVPMGKTTWRNFFSEGSILVFCGITLIKGEKNGWECCSNLTCIFFKFLCVRAPMDSRSLSLGRITFKPIKGDLVYYTDDVPRLTTYFYIFQGHDLDHPCVCYDEPRASLLTHLEVCKPHSYLIDFILLGADNWPCFFPQQSSITTDLIEDHLPMYSLGNVASFRKAHFRSHIYKHLLKTYRGQGSILNVLMMTGMVL